MTHPNPVRRPRLPRLTAAALALVITAAGLTAAPAAVAEPIAPTRDNGPATAAKPYLGWSSWSLQATNYPGVNPDGPGSWLHEDRVRAQADVMAADLAEFGYEYINIDAGWQSGGDEHGLPTVNQDRFPSGIKALSDYVHDRGLRFGIYTVVGLGKDVYRDGTTPIKDAPGCTTADLVYDDLRTTNGWDMSYKINYDSPCAQAYADSIARVFADWGVDFIKIDGVGPGSFKGGANYDNRADIEAWSKAIKKTGRSMNFLLSWSISHRYADEWKQWSNGVRVDTDVECYCDTLVKWDQSVKQRWFDSVQWLDDAGAGFWPNLDSLNVGNGEMDGLTKAERQSYVTLWSIAAAPLYIGDDLTRLDAYGKQLLTNREVIAINQRGNAARPLSQSSQQQVWSARNDDGSNTVALFNLAGEPAKVSASWRELGFDGPAKVRDVWQGKDLGVERSGIGADLPVHGSRLFTVRPVKPHAAQPSIPTGLRATDAGPDRVTLAWQPATDGGEAPDYAVLINGREALRTGDTDTVITGLDPATAYRFEIRAVGARHTSAPGAPLRITTPGADGPREYEAEDPANQLAGGAGIWDCDNCSGGRKAGYIGGSGTMSFPAITAPADGSYLLTIDYVAADSSRQAKITINDKITWINAPGTNDEDWNTPQTLQVMVDLKAGPNKITFGNPSSSAPDLDRLTL
ncbi:fibronectin type III domain-containing protein [Microlunatus speluncae]|uniref:fibronectin type III domain-containing protein n=1 Tax=Microlunatus speluncae TaxID=2594267 RepID=UPI0012663CFB|nr:alpha-galactosidase [Microlunatus speluncae]